MHTRIQKWGNSLALRIPAPFAQEVGIRNDTEVDLVIDHDGSLRVTPVKSPRYDLDSLLAGVSDDNLHAEADFGPRRGKELL